MQATIKVPAEPSSSSAPMLVDVAQHASTSGMAGPAPVPAEADGMTTVPASTSHATHAGGPSANVSSALERIMNHSGGVVELRHVPTLEDLYEEQHSDDMRQLLLLVLKQSSHEVKAQVVKGRVLKTIEGWVSDALDSAKAQPQKHEVLSAVVACLGSLPMDLQTLRRTGIGRVVGSLRRQISEDLSAAAKGLVERWRLLANSNDDPHEPTAAAEGARKRSDASGSSAGGEDLPSHKRSRHQEGATSPSSSSGGGVPGPRLQATNDDDLLREDAPHSSGGIRNAVPTPRRLHTLQRIEQEDQSGTGTAGAATEPSGSNSSRAEGSAPAMSPRPVAAGAAGVPASTVQPFTGTRRLGTIAGSFGVGSAAAGRLGSLRDGAAGRGPPGGPAVMRPGMSGATAAAAAAAAAAASGVGPSSSGVFSGPGAAPGGSTAQLKAAMARASAAPDSAEPGPRKPKLKSVSWAREEALVCLRWFKKDDPPNMARTDSMFTDEELECQAHPPGSRLGFGLPFNIQAASGFQNVAKREHTLERNALQALHAQEEVERKQMLDRLRAMGPIVPWPRSVPTVEMDPNWMVAFGEDSVERGVQEERAERTLPVSYPSWQHVPPSPAEPPHDAEAPSLYAAVPTIPLTVPIIVPPPAAQSEPASASHRHQAELYGGPQQQQQQQPSANAAAAPLTDISHILAGIGDISALSALLPSIKDQLPALMPQAPSQQHQQQHQLQPEHHLSSSAINNGGGPHHQQQYATPGGAYVVPPPPPPDRARPQGDGYWAGPGGMHGGDRGVLGGQWDQGGGSGPGAWQDGPHHRGGHGGGGQMRGGYRGGHGPGAGPGRGKRLAEDACGRFGGGGGGGSREVCIFFNLQVGCRHGNGCRFSHVKLPPDEVARLISTMPTGAHKERLEREYERGMGGGGGGHADGNGGRGRR